MRVILGLCSLKPTLRWLRGLWMEWAPEIRCPCDFSLLRNAILKCIVRSLFCECVVRHHLQHRLTSRVSVLMNWKLTVHWMEIYACACEDNYFEVACSSIAIDVKAFIKVFLFKLSFSISVYAQRTSGTIVMWCCRFINARRRIVQPMIDQSNRAGQYICCLTNLWMTKWTEL
jgi:hypothetical protein